MLARLSTSAPPPLFEPHVCIGLGPTLLCYYCKQTRVGPPDRLTRPHQTIFFVTTSTTGGGDPPHPPFFLFLVINTRSRSALRGTRNFSVSILHNICEFPRELWCVDWIVIILESRYRVPSLWCLVVITAVNCYYYYYYYYALEFVMWLLVFIYYDVLFSW